jgi:hypothetical protein
LYDGEEGFALFTKHFIGFKKKIFIADSPNIHRLVLKFSFNIHLDAINVFYQSFKIVEAGTASKKIEFLVTGKIINNGALIQRLFIPC